MLSYKDAFYNLIGSKIKRYFWPLHINAVISYKGLEKLNVDIFLEVVYWSGKGIV
jgi:hypothetical protein